MAYTFILEEHEYDREDARRVRALLHAADLPKIARLAGRRSRRDSIRRLPTFGRASWWYDRKRAEADERWYAQRAIDDGEPPF